MTQRAQVSRSRWWILGGRLVASALLVGVIASCVGTTEPPPPPEPVCESIPEIDWRMPETRTTPVPYTPNEADVALVKMLKDVVYTHARDPKNPWAVSHALLAIGPDAILTNDKKAVDYLFEEYAETFEVCGETLIRFPRSRGDIRIEPHTDLILKALTENAVPPETPVTVQGKKLTVGHLYRGSLHRAWVEGSTVPFGPGDGPGDQTNNWNDVPWALQGLTAYGPKGLTWTAEGGRKMDMDAFVHATVDRLDAESQALQVAQQAGQTFNKVEFAKAGGLVSMTCGGAHMLQGTAHALGRGYGEEGDRTRYQAQIDILFWRYQAELDAYTEALQTQPRYRTLIMMQRLKFLGHFLETTHKWAILGLFVPDEAQHQTMRDATVQLLATGYVLNQQGIYANLSKMIDPATPVIYPGLITNEQLYLDYVGDSAHAYRGLDLAIGHGKYAY